MKIVRWFIILGSCFAIASSLTGCVTDGMPTHEYNIAKAAYDAAEAREAAKYAPQLFYKMEKSFKKAELLYKERYYEEARKEFIKAQKLAEKAETQARIKEFTSGEVDE